MGIMSYNFKTENLDQFWVIVNTEYKIVLKGAELVRLLKIGFEFYKPAWKIIKTGMMWPS